MECCKVYQALFLRFLLVLYQTSLEESLFSFYP